MQSGMVICTRCGQHGAAREKSPGSMGFGCILLFFFIIPGVLYFMWQLMNQERVCASCGSKEIVPLSSPRGRQQAEEILRARRADTRMVAEIIGHSRCPTCGTPPPAGTGIGATLFCPSCGTKYIRDVDKAGPRSGAPGSFLGGDMDEG